MHAAIVGASTLKGKELKQALQERAFPTRRLTLLDDEEVRGKLTEFQGEPALIHALTGESFTDVDFAFFASEPAFTGKHWRLAASQRCRIIDLSGALEREPGAHVAGPLATGTVPESSGRLFVAAHPAALVIAAVIRRLPSIQRAIVTAFEPASERGAEGVDELHQQAVSLFSFQSVPQRVFGAQVAFNLLAARGPESRPSLAEIEERIDRHVSLLNPAGPRPSIRLAQSPTFHSHTFAFYMETATPRDARAVERALDSDGFDVRRAGAEAPNAVDAASSADILIGDIRPDRASDRGFWAWAAADNLRLAAVNAVMIAEQLV